MIVRNVHAVLGRGAVAASALLVCLLGGVRPAAAEIVFFSNGRTMSVRSHQVDGDRLVLTLRAGGEMVVEASLVAEIGPDEVPYPEPADDTPEPAAPPVPAVKTATPVVSPVYDPLIRKAAAEHGVHSRQGRRHDEGRTNRLHCAGTDERPRGVGSGRE